MAVKQAQNPTESAEAVLNQYKEGLAYKKQQGYLLKWPEYERFRAGDQWPKVTNRTKDLPRPVFNLIDQIQSHKVSSVMNDQIKMVFTPMESPSADVQEQQDPNQIDPESQAADLFTKYSESTWERLKQDDLNEEALDSASNTGTCIWHYYWDASKTGGNQLKWIGEMMGEVIDPVNFFPGNPQQRDTQKQPYIIITHRDEVKNIQDEAKANGIGQEQIVMIQPDKDVEDQAYDMARYEISGSQKATVLTKYWRDTDGLIYFMKVCGNVMVKPKTNTQKKLYPLEVMQWKRRKKSIFGVGDTEGLIPNQKAINFLIAMQILSVQNTGWPKMLLKKEFIKQNPSNTPGEILVDSGPPGTWNAQYMMPGTLSPVAGALVENILSYTKEISGANEFSMGEMNGSRLNASAIMMLQRAAGVSIESIKRRFYQSMENIARIWEEFWKVNYNITRLITVQNDNQEPVGMKFNGSQFANIDMDLKIDIGPASAFSESMVLDGLNKLHDSGQINTIQFLKYMPISVAPYKDRLINELQDQQAQQQPQQKQDIPSLSIAFKDLPPSGQAQMAALAGIQLNPNEIQQQQMAQQPQAQPQNPFDQILAQLPAHEQQQFKKLPPDKQKAIVDQMMALQQQPPQGGN